MAATLTLTLRGTSAQIILLPGAALQPVQQKNGPGRRPLMVVDLFYWHTRRNAAQNQRLQDEDEDEVAHTLEVITNAEFVLQQARYALAVLKQTRNGATDV